MDPCGAQTTFRRPTFRGRRSKWRRLARSQSDFTMDRSGHGDGPSTAATRYPVISKPQVRLVHDLSRVRNALTAVCCSPGKFGKTDVSPKPVLTSWQEDTSLPQPLHPKRIRMSPQQKAGRQAPNAGRDQLHPLAPHHVPTWSLKSFRLAVSLHTGVCSDRDLGDFTSLSWQQDRR